MKIQVYKDTSESNKNWYDMFKYELNPKGARDLYSDYVKCFPNERFRIIDENGKTILDSGAE